MAKRCSNCAQERDLPVAGRICAECAARLYVLGCPTCEREKAAGNAFFPRHEASRRCESGKRPHCSCDTCF